MRSRPERKPKPLERASTDEPLSPSSSNSVSGPASEAAYDDVTSADTSADKVKVWAHPQARGSYYHSILLLPASLPFHPVNVAAVALGAQVTGYLGACC